jgi:predicted SAM-dependent methyltransferase
VTVTSPIKENRVNSGPAPSPLLVRIRRKLAKLRRAYNRRVGPRRLRRALASTDAPRVVIGSGATQLGGHRHWISTDREFLNLLQPSDWQGFFQPNSIAAMLAEHVWEHLTHEQGLAAARTCYTYLRPGGYLRLGVPDGLHPNPEYIEWVRVGGRSPMQVANDHKVLYTYQSLRSLLEQAGFRVQLYEYFDENGVFHEQPWDPAAGMIRRSRRFDKRNKGGSLTFTSIVLDAVKDA